MFNRRNNHLTPNSGEYLCMNWYCANRFPLQRMPLLFAAATREHNDANMLAMGARVIGSGLALRIVDTFLDTSFSNEERHNRRINMIED